MVTSFFWLRFPYFLLQKQGYILLHLHMVFPASENSAVMDFQYLDQMKWRFTAGPEAGSVFLEFYPNNWILGLSSMLSSEHLLLDPGFVAFC